MVFSAAPSLAGVGLREGLIPAFEPPPIRASPPVADHELLGIIGKGAYGEVWLGRHTRLSVLRAVKIVRRSQFAEARPFQREFEGIRRYEPISRGHPNLVNVLHVGGTDECFYYVMELADPAGGGESKVQGGRPSAHPNRDRGMAGAGARVPDFGFPSVPGGGALDFYTPLTLRQLLREQGPLPVNDCVAVARGLANFHLAMARATA